MAENIKYVKALDGSYRPIAAYSKLAVHGGDGNWYIGNGVVADAIMRFDSEDDANEEFKKLGNKIDLVNFFDDKPHKPRK